MLKLNKAVRMFAFILVLSLPISQAHAINSNLCSNVFLIEEPLNSQFILSEHAFGQIVRYISDPSLKGPLKETLRIGTYNILNLYEHTPRKDRVYPLEKDHARRLGNAKSIHDIDPDFQILVEVENVEAARAFNRDYLGNRYETLLLEGNDHGNINIALLVRQNLPVEIEWRSYRGFNNNIFSRDLPVGLVFDRNAAGEVALQPKLAILGTHYKSKRSDPGQGDQTANKRRQQVAATLEIVEGLQKEFGPELPIILAGDFNSSLHTSAEFTGLFTKGFKDTLDLVETNPMARATHYYFTPDKQMPEASQLDGILTLSPRIEVLAGRVVPDRDNAGEPLRAPISYEEREQRPSDHRPVGVEIKLKNLSARTTLGLAPLPFE